MDDRLLIPATPALLEGWCGPVVYLHRHCVCFGERVPYFLDPETGDEFGMEGADAHGGVWLDLARDEVADRLARWFWRVKRSDEPRRGVSFALVNGYTGPTLVMLTMAVENGKPMSESLAFDGNTVAALATLDPDSDERLPTGARLVDRLALACVARAVLLDEVTHGE